MANVEKMKVDPFSIAIFLSVVEEGSITKAAIRHGISQPAASLRIRELEETLALHLLDRNGPTVAPTKEASLIIDQMRKVIATNDELLSLSNRIKSQRGSGFTLAVSMTIAEYLLPIWLSEVSGRTDIKIENVEIGNSTFVIDRVDRGVSDIGLIEGATSPPHLGSTEIYHDQLVLVATSKHLTAKGLSQNLHSDEIPNCDFILRENGSGTRDVFEIEIAKLSQSHHLLLSLPSTTAIKGAVARSMGIGVISRLAVLDELATGQFVEVSIKGLEMSRTLRAVYKPNVRNPSLKKFIQIIMKTTH